MNDNELITKKCIEDIEDRVGGVFNDLKAFVYIRNNNLQHKKENIGGGNMVTALSLFTCINFLAKTYYCTIRKDKFDVENGSSLNETEAFVHYMNFIQKSGLDLGLPSKGNILELVWSGFRDWLAHRLTVQPGKQVINFIFEVDSKATIAESLKYAKKHKVFQDDGNGRNWVVNCDVLLANLPDIIKLTTEHLKSVEDIDNKLLLKVIGIEYP